MVANWTLGGMFPEQDMAHIALIHIDQTITLLGVNAIPRPLDLPFPIAFLRMWRELEFEH